MGERAPAELRQVAAGCESGSLSGSHIPRGGGARRRLHAGGLAPLVSPAAGLGGHSTARPGQPPGLSRLSNTWLCVEQEMFQTRDRGRQCVSVGETLANPPAHLPSECPGQEGAEAPLLRCQMCQMWGGPAPRSCALRGAPPAAFGPRCSSGRRELPGAASARRQLHCGDAPPTELAAPPPPAPGLAPLGPRGGERGRPRWGADPRPRPYLPLW